MAAISVWYNQSTSTEEGMVHNVDRAQELQQEFNQQRVSL